MATFFVVAAMDKIFGKAEYPEKSIVKSTLYVIIVLTLVLVFGFV